jgi:hypothetical protein
MTGSPAESDLNRNPININDRAEKLNARANPKAAMRWPDRMGRNRLTVLLRWPSRS